MFVWRAAEVHKPNNFRKNKNIEKLKIQKYIRRNGISERRLLFFKFKDRYHCAGSICVGGGKLISQECRKIINEQTVYFATSLSQTMNYLN